MPMRLARLSLHTATPNGARLFLALVLLVGAIPLIARGQAREVESVRVRYDVETGMPGVRTFRVSVARGEGRVVGRLVVEDGDRASVPRVVTGATCEEVTRGPPSPEARWRRRGYRCGICERSCGRSWI